MLSLLSLPCPRPTSTSPLPSSPSPLSNRSRFRRSLLSLFRLALFLHKVFARPLGSSHVGTSAFPYLNGGPGLVTTDKLGEMTVRINNCSPAELVLPKNSIIGFFKPVNSATIQELKNDTFINAVNKVSSHFPPLLSVPDQK
jgi:hypothetical protein